MGTEQALAAIASPTSPWTTSERYAEPGDFVQSCVA
jgi:hypothetical protein